MFDLTMLLNINYLIIKINVACEFLGYNTV